MLERKQLRLFFLTPLELEPKRKASCFLLAIAHLLLGLNLLSIYMQMLPIYIYPLSILIYIIKRKRATPLAVKALKVLRNRLIVHFASILSFFILMNTLPIVINPINVWSILIFLLTPLSIYDALRSAEGKNGFTLEILKVRS